jgi:23S rRNA (adenine-N6)-dimethyltransferase
MLWLMLRLSGTSLTMGLRLSRIRHRTMRLFCLPTHHLRSVAMSAIPLRYTQNFLRDPLLVTRLLDLSDIESEDTVVEIGPGKGIITEQLAERCRCVIAVEKDVTLARALQQRYAGCERVTVHVADFLAFPLPRARYKVFANIPFNCTHDIVTKLTRCAEPPQTAYLAMQREAAQKFAGIGREYLYSILLKPWFEVDVVYQFQRSDFVPVPQVDAAFLRIRKRGPPLVSRQERQLFRDFAVYGFTTRQPTLGRIFRDILTNRQQQQASKRFEIDFDATPSLMPFPQWLLLFQYFMQVSGPDARLRVSGGEARLHGHQAQLQKVHRTRMPRRR